MVEDCRSRQLPVSFRSQARDTITMRSMIDSSLGYKP